MKGLIARPGTLRQGAVGIARRGKITHLAPPVSMVHPLMRDLLRYVRSGADNLLIRSCVFHYELEFIHPFADGNGRLGRLWQTVILRREFPVFEFLPLESLVHDRQKAYYAALAGSDAKGEATPFVEFMLAAMRDALEEYAGRLALIRPSPNDRLEYARTRFGVDVFSRQAYRNCLKTVSAPTASRDLHHGVQSGILTRTGEKRTTRYRFVGRTRA
jgi:Fic family protein